MTYSVSKQWFMLYINLYFTLIKLKYYGKGPSGIFFHTSAGYGNSLT